MAEWGCTVHTSAVWSRAASGRAASAAAQASKPASYDWLRNPSATSPPPPFFLGDARSRTEDGELATLAVLRWFVS